MIKVTGTRLTKELIKDMYNRGNKIQLSNIYLFKWESDVFNLSKSDIVTEYEIKVSRSDFFADFNKTEKHKVLEDAHLKGILNNDMPQYFYYATPKGLLSVDEIPDYAGLVEFNGSYFDKKKEAPKLHSIKFQPEFWEVLAMKLYYKTI